ncbi:putative replication factor c subunit 2 [Phaeomoniella chlamydospora]|uniref:Putative replication factor c subunit 2 n=1 Tax=Phaeomoniella chlamydospora TaxID=158046 RepID=A0A0G2EH20_PHACM|nr:putative replication factor c subunit 2 [Phaeomoniella chlamydospora]
MADFFNNRARQAAASASGSSKVPKKETEEKRQDTWVERHRPRTLDDITGQNHTVEILRRTLGAANLPHMLYYGPPGVGKTTTILALARQLFGPLFSSRVLELNSSDERGISVVRERIKGFASQQISKPPKDFPYPCPPFKIVILDEADNMVADAQNALRRTMEIYSKTTRFVLCCNFPSRIIDPIASRCSKFRFRQLDGEDAGQRLKNIAEAENVQYEDGVIEKLLQTSEGDLRRAITYLQSAATLVNASSLTLSNDAQSKKRRKIVDQDSDEDMTDVDSITLTNPQVTVSIIEEIAGVVPDSWIRRLISVINPSSSLSSSKSKSRYAYTEIASVITDLIAEGYSANQVINQLFKAVLYEDETIGNVKKNQIVGVLSEIDKRLIDGADEELTLLDTGLKMAGILAKC